MFINLIFNKSLVNRFKEHITFQHSSNEVNQLINVLCNLSSNDYLKNHVFWEHFQLFLYHSHGRMF